MTLLESVQQEKLLKSTENGCIYLVRDRESGQRRIYREFEGNGEVYRKLSQLHSPHLPRIYQVQQEGNRTVVLEEYIPGDTLAFLLEGAVCRRSRRRRFSASSAMRSQRCIRQASSTGISSRRI